MKVLVTGATGFIGRRVVERLIKSSHQVRCLVRKTSPVNYIPQDGLDLITGDITDRSSVLQATKDCDWVINLAGLYSFWIPRKETYFDVNVKGARFMAECAVESGVSKFIHISTLGTYGKPSDWPYREESPRGPVRFSRYFQTKYEGEMIVREICDAGGLPLVIIYPCAVLGADDPKATGSYISNLIRRKLPATVADKSDFTFVHVDDVAEIIVRAAEMSGNAGEGYIAGNTRMTFGEINKLISEVSGVPLPKISLPNFMSLLNARLATAVSDIIKRPPIWGLAIDQIEVMINGASADGSKAERELGIEYTPIRKAIEEEVASIRASEGVRNTATVANSEQKPDKPAVTG